jgi:arylsulfatase A-like enzyme
MSEKMNVLFIITDQQRADHLGCSGNPVLKTPNLDRLASESIRFTSAFCTNPMCMPNRATILTGLYPNMHGVRSNGINLPLNVPTITDTLKKHGYHTISIGKIHLQYWARGFDKSVTSVEAIGPWLSEKYRPQMKENLTKPYYGFDEVDMVVGHGDLCAGHYFDWLEERGPQYIEPIKEKFKSFFNLPYYETILPEELYPTSYMTEKTISFLERYSQGNYGNKPFFLHCSIPDPHHPVCPPGKYKDMYKPEDIELPSSFDDAKNLESHEFLGQHIKNPAFRGALLRVSTEQEVKDFIALTYGLIAMIDDGIGQILASLEKLGLAENTMVIYTSDHGDLMGDHGMILKGPCPFKGILNVPLLWKVPGLTKPDVSESLASSIDIPKTILNLLGIRKRFHPPDMQGIDLTPVLKDPSTKVRKSCLIEEDEEFPFLHKGVNIRLRHLVTEEYKLTLYENLRGYGDLYSRKNDPDEMNNLWHTHKEARYELVEQLFHENLKAQSRYPKRIAPT